MKRTAMMITAALLIAPATFAARVDRREVHQQSRIAQGVKSGQLTPLETARLESREARLQREKHDMREDNGGTLTTAEKVKLNNQQNRLSRAIYVQKHDGQHR